MADRWELCRVMTSTIEIYSPVGVISLSLNEFMADRYRNRPHADKVKASYFNETISRLLLEGWEPLGNFEFRRRIN